jgi:DNA-binding response OmpR family regulator
MTTIERPARLLVVDDDDDIRALYSATLQYAGYYPRLAASGEQALAEARELPPDVVISDVSMPGLSGLEVCRLLKTEPRTSRSAVLLISALAGAEHRAAGLAAGADDYLTKPISPSQLLHRVRQLLGSLT